MNKIFNTTIILLLLLISATTSVVEAKAMNQLTIQAEKNVSNLAIALKDNFIKAKYASAENKFIQGNVNAAHDDYSSIISKISHDDYVFLAYAIKLAEYGFFDLSDELFKKLDLNVFTENYISDIKKYYYPSSMVNMSDIIYLADAYASIVYNNLAIETTSELINNSKLEDSDYKNYLIALGYYKSNNLQQALKYINNAIIQNDCNVNYQILKIKVLADSKKLKQAFNLLKEVKKVEFLTVDFQEKISTVEEYLLYKAAKAEPLKDYHLSYYYHLQNKSLLATKVLQASILQAKEHAPLIFGLLALIYYENDEPLKAQEFAERAYKDDKKNYFALITLANLNFDERKYAEALEYYSSAKKCNKKSSEAIIGVAKTYAALDKTNKSKKIYEKMLKKNSLDEELLVGSLNVFPQRADEYLPRIASIDVLNSEIWLALAYRAILDKNYVMAETYLNNSYYIDENSFKYYYYLSLVLKAKGEIDKAKQALIKCTRLNSGYVAVVDPE